MSDGTGHPARRRVALITGASRGIGRGIALALAGAGHDVVVNYVRDAAAAGEVVAAVRAAGGRARAVQADISRPVDRSGLVEEAYRTFGRIDLLVDNAGVPPAARTDLLEATEESFDRVLGINLKGPYFLTQLVARRMVEQVEQDRREDVAADPPRIVVVSSISAYTASTDRGDYCLAKAGLSMLVALFASRLAEHGITVHEIRPGIIATDMTAPVRERYDERIAAGLTPIRRWGTPDDVARAVVAIASGLLPFSTGQVIDVDGGFHLHRL